MKKVSTVILYIILILSSFIFAGRYLFYTPSGLKFLIKVLPFITEHELSISEGTGVLAKKFELKNICYQSNGNKITVSDLNITWQFHEIK
jgi:hypothetical protein